VGQICSNKKTDSFVTHVNASFVQKVLYTPEGKRKPDIHHHRKTDDFWAGFEVAKRRAFCHEQKLIRRPALHNRVSSDTASQENLKGIYVAGGGGEGAINALRDSGAAGHTRLILHPITEETRNALDEGNVTMIIGTPIDRLSRCLIAEMAAFILGHVALPESQILLSPEFLLPGQAQN
jgi:hypothetical protein